jgi:hypothetical protein
MTVLLKIKLKQGTNLFSLNEITYFPTGNKFFAQIKSKDIPKWIESEQVKSIKVMKLFNK